MFVVTQLNTRERKVAKKKYQCHTRERKGQDATK